MYNHKIRAGERVLYAFGMLLSMQNVVNENGEKVQNSLTPSDVAVKFQVVLWTTQHFLRY